jgi:cyanophycinase
MSRQNRLPCLVDCGMASRFLPPAAGVLMAIGGAEDKLGDKAVLARFVRLAGGESARVLVVSTASSLGDEITDLYRAVFAELGVTQVEALRPRTREQAEQPAPVAAVERASGIFLTGGNQLRLTMVVGGTAMGRALTEAYVRGAVVAGTSAGASAIAEHMVSFGRPGETPRQRMGQLSKGLGLLPGVVIDQHFGQRNRIGRLLAMVAQSPALLGVGVDEDTAAVIGGDGVLEVIGRGAVTVVDGANVVSDAYEVRQHRPVLVSGAVLHALPPGYRFDLAERKLLPRLTSLEDGERPRRRSPGRLAKAVAAEGASDHPPRSRPGGSDSQEAST